MDKPVRLYEFFGISAKSPKEQMKDVSTIPTAVCSANCAVPVGANTPVPIGTSCPVGAPGAVVSEDGVVVTPTHTYEIWENDYHGNTSEVIYSTKSYALASHLISALKVIDKDRWNLTTA